jgi:UPF0755 protein
MKTLIAGLLLLLPIAAGGLFYYANQPLNLPHTPFEFELKQGGNLKAVTHELKQASLLNQEWPFMLLARVLKKSEHLEAGYYVINQPITPIALLDMLHKGTVIQRKLTIAEGWTFSQFRAALDANPDLKHTTTGMSSAEILHAIGAKEHEPEGLFFPDTYYFATGTRDIVILERAYKLMQERLNDAWNNRAPDLPLKNPYEALILASIVEKETGAPADRTKVAAVFINRLRKGMLLQTDPTVIYGMGKNYTGNLHKQDLRADTPYNTYTRPGLTPTPISLPGMAALQATLHPEDIDALFFVSRGDGSSEFSSTLSAHNQAVYQYQIKKK